MFIGASSVSDLLVFTVVFKQTLCYRPYTHKVCMGGQESATNIIDNNKLISF